MKPTQTGDLFWLLETEGPRNPVNDAEGHESVCHARYWRWPGNLNVMASGGFLFFSNGPY